MAEFTVPSKIAAIIERLHTQDNRITNHPLFAVQQRRRIYGLHAEYRDGVEWIGEDGEQTDAEVAGSRKVGYIDKWEFVTGCMTEQGCKDFIACNGHNLNEPRIYAYSGYRNAEFIAVREWLMSLRASPIPEGCTPADAKEDQRAVRWAIDRLEHYLDAVDQECDCEECPQCQRLPADCSGTECAKTCQCCECERCQTKGALEALRSAAAGSAALPPPPPESGLTDAQAEALIEASDGHWKEDVFCIGGPELMALLRAAAAVPHRESDSTDATKGRDHG